MMMSEFIDRTGFEPTYEEYQEIEEAYYNFDGNKDEFCVKWLADGGIMNTCRARAKKIDQLNSKILELDRVIQQDIHAKEMPHSLYCEIYNLIPDTEEEAQRQMNNIANLMADNVDDMKIEAVRNLAKSYRKQRDIRDKHHALLEQLDAYEPKEA